METEVSKLESFIPMEKRNKWKYYWTPNVKEGHDNTAASNKRKKSLRLFF